MCFLFRGYPNHKVVVCVLVIQSRGVLVSYLQVIYSSNINSELLLVFTTSWIVDVLINVGYINSSDTACSCAP